MIPDYLLRLADGQSLDGATTKTTSAVDLDTLRDIGTGTTMYLRIRFDTAYTHSTGGSNIVFGYADNDSASNLVILGQLQLGVGASVPAQGEVIYFTIPPLSKVKLGALPNNTKKYFLVQHVPFSGTPSGGSWTVEIVTEINMVEHTYTKGFTVQ
jgi:hypothetical protein